MTTTTSTRDGDTGRHATAGDAGDDVGSRGSTRIAPRAVERIAAQAVQEVDQATGTARRVLGVSVGSTGETSRADVSARVDGETATVEVTMTVIYPASVRDVTRRTRDHITERVRELAAVHVQQVDITVTGMTVARPDAPRVR